MLSLENQIMDRNRLNAMHYPLQASSLPYFSSSSYLSEGGDINHSTVLPAEQRQVGFWKGEQEASAHLDQQRSAIFRVDNGMTQGHDAQGTVCVDEFHPQGKGETVADFQNHWQRSSSIDWSSADQAGKGSTDRLVIGAERTTSLGAFSWSGAGDIQKRGLRDLSPQTAANLNYDLLEAHKGGASRGDVNGLQDLFSSLFERKLALDATEQTENQATEEDTSREAEDKFEDGDHHYGSLEDMESQTIGKLLPDDEEELFAGMVEEYEKRAMAPGNTILEEGEDFDLFSSGGGLELEGEGGEGLGGGKNQSGQQGAAGSAALAGEHPFGEHPSRTLFVRNINSNVEDLELRALFEQYGDIRTLYTACKHRGFVMISYYDIRAARAAMRALQNKPLRRRKLDIHFSIPKENPSDKDVNQGTLVVFNLDASVSNEELRQIFGVYGEVKEIRETPNKRHHKFIEFYDVRAAESALRALNRSDIAGKRIKLEPSRPGGARRSLMHQLGQDGDPEDGHSLHQHSASLAGSPPLVSSAWGSSSTLSEIDAAASRSMQRSHSSSSSLVSALYRSLSSAQTTAAGTGMAGSLGAIGSSLPPHPSSPARAASTSSLIGLQSQHEAMAQSMATSHLGGLARLPPQHPQSLPDILNGMISQGHYGQASALASAAAAAAAAGASARSRDGQEGAGRMLHRASSTSALGGSANDHAGEHPSSGLGSSSLGGHHYPSTGSLGGGSGSSSSISGSQSFMWGTSGSSSSFRQSLHSQGSPPVVWPPSHDLPFQAPSAQEQSFQQSLQQAMLLEQAYPQSLLAEATYNGPHASALDQAAYQAALEQTYSQSVAQTLARSAHNLSQAQTRSHVQALSNHILTSSRSHGHSLALQRGMLASSNHHVGSDPLLLSRQYSFLSESPDSNMRSGSLGALGNGGLGNGMATNLGNIISSMRENGLERGLDRYRLGLLSGENGMDNGPPSPSVLSPQVRARSHNAGSAGMGPGQAEHYGDRSRGRQREQGNADSKKQFQLDLEKILRGEDPRTTLMIKNIPNKYTQKMLLAAIDEHHKGTYDFFYLPIDFKNKCNVGYAFINMTDPYKIIPFFQAFNGKKWEKFNSEKVATLAYARIQGKLALVAHFQNSSLMNEDKRCRPILFHSEGPHAGDQEPFPVGMNVRPRMGRERERANGASGSHQGSPATSTSSRDDSNHGGNAFGSGSASFGGSYLRSGSMRGREGDDLSPDF